MTRTQFIARIATRFRSLTAKDVEASVDALLAALANAMCEGRRAELRGFGTFSVHIRAPRLGRNPATGVSVSIPAKPRVHFKAGSGLRARVDAGANHARGNAKPVKEFVEADA